MSRHRWSVEDDLAALYVFKFGTCHTRFDVVRVAERLGIDPGSFRMRVANFKAIAGEGGLGNYARQSRQVFEKYGDLEEPELRKMAFPRLG